MRKTWLQIANVIVLALLLSGILNANNLPAKIGDKFGKFPVYFVQNQGQLDARVNYYAPGLENTVYFSNHGLTFLLHPKKREDNDLQPASLNSIAGKKNTNAWAVQLDFIGASDSAKLEGQLPTSAVFNYFRGPRENWKMGVKTFSSLKYSNLWPGIDLVYNGTNNQIKYSLVVRSGAEPNQIQLLYKGATDITLRENGELNVSTPIGSFQDGAPIAYQEIDGQQKEVAVQYSLKDRNKDGSYSYGFELGSYDQTKPLILDPVIFLYSGFLGGDKGYDTGFSIAVDRSGNAYVGGWTDSDETTFPVTVGPYVHFNGGFLDGFVAKIAPNATLVYAGYIGGSGEDAIEAIAVDPKGNAYVTGTTTSSSGFPIVGGLGSSYQGGPYDAFAAKIDSSGTFLRYSGYIGGIQNDEGTGIALDDRGNAYITGMTASDENSFPVTVGPDLSYNGGPNDAFVCKINSRGSALDYCGYIGGTEEDIGYDVAVLKDVAFVTGKTESDQTTFPVVKGPDLTYDGQGDGFVARVKPSGASLVYAGYIGGAGFEHALGISLDRRGNAYIVGTTASDESTFPVLVGPDLTWNGDYDAFISKLTPTGKFIYSGYIGGTNADFGYAVDTDSSGNAYITGYTGSDETSFPVVDGPDLTFNGFVDGFVARLNASGLAFDYCGYIGGSSGEIAADIAVDDQQNAYIIGYGSSTETTFPVLLGPDLTYNGGGTDGFVVKVSPP